MPTVDMLVTVTVGVDAGPGKPQRAAAVSFRVAGNGTPGLSLTDPKKLKLGTVVEQMGTILDADRSDL